MANILRVMGCSSHNYASQEQYLVLLSKHLAKKGHNHYVVYENKPDNIEFIKDLQSTGTKLFRIKPRRYFENSMSNSFLRKVIVPIYDIFDFSSIRSLSKLIYKYDIDIVHSYFSRSMYSLTTAKYLGLKTCKTLSNPFMSSQINRGLSYYKKFYIYLKDVLPLVLVDRQIALSEITKNELKHYTLDSNRVRHISSGIDTSKYDPSKYQRGSLRKELGLSSSDLIIGYTGRIDNNQKNLLFSIDIVSEIFAERENVYFVLAGESYGSDMNWENFIVEKSTMLGISDRVIFLGRRNDISSILKDFDIYLIPSFYEGLPSSLMEAMSMGLTCFTSDAAAFKELIVHSKNGFTYDMYSASDYSRNIIKLLDNNNLRSIIGRNARETIVKNYHVEKRATKTTELYEELSNNY